MDRPNRDLVKALAHSYGFWVGEAATEGERCKQGIRDLRRWTKGKAVRVMTPRDAKREQFFVVYHARSAARAAGRAIRTLHTLGVVLER